MFVLTYVDDDTSYYYRVTEVFVILDRRRHCPAIALTLPPSFMTVQTAGMYLPRAPMHGRLFPVAGHARHAAA